MLFQIGSSTLQQPSSPVVSRKGKEKEVVDEDFGSDDMWAEFGEEDDYSALLDENPTLLDSST